MPVPIQYTEPQFRAYLVGVLDEVGSIIGWNAASTQVVEAATDALLEFGVTDITTVTKPRSLMALRALGRRAIWRGVVQAVSGKYDFRDSDATFTRSQVQEMALESLKLAERDCAGFDANYAVTVLKVSRPQDPYSVIPDAERVL